MYILLLRWPMIIDPSKQAATFLRYRDTNYLNCCNPRDMEPEVIRMALLGSIRYMYVCTVCICILLSDYPAAKYLGLCVQLNVVSFFMHNMEMKLLKGFFLVHCAHELTFLHL